MAVLVLFWVASLPHMSIGAGIVGPVPLQKIDNTPYAQASAQGHNKGLQSGDRGSEKLHISSFSPGNPGHEKSRHFWRRRNLWTLCPEVFIQRRPDRPRRRS